MYTFAHTFVYPHTPNGVLMWTEHLTYRWKWMRAIERVRRWEGESELTWANRGRKSKRRRQLQLFRIRVCTPKLSTMSIFWKIQTFLQLHWRPKFCAVTIAVVAVETISSINAHETTPINEQFHCRIWSNWKHFRESLIYFNCNQHWLTD